MNDATSSETIERVGNFLLSLHRLPFRVAFSDYQESALSLLSAILPFDKAWWGLVSGLNLHTEVAYGLPTSYSQDWERVKVSDPIAAEAITNPSKTVLFNEKDLQEHVEAAQFLARHGIKHVMCTHMMDQPLGLHAFISLYRERQPFMETERQLKQIIMPHMVHALHLSWRRHLESELYELTSRNRLVGNAISDKKGLILSADESFARTLMEELPKWRGPILPDQFLSSMEKSVVYYGNKIIVNFADAGDLVVVRVAQSLFLQQLSPRERAVAELYASGKTHKTIARDLGISPTTARHYVRTVFMKLGVTNKAELARVVFER